MVIETLRYQIATTVLSMVILKNFFLIRMATGFVGISIPFLLANQMSIKDFATYSIVSATAALAVAFSSAGVDRACLKALPSFASNILNRGLGKLVCGLAATRFAALFFVCFVMIGAGVGLPDNASTQTQDVSVVLALIAATAVSTALNQFTAAAIQGLLLHNAFALVLLSVTLLRAVLVALVPIFGISLDFVVALLVVVVTELISVCFQVGIIAIHARRCLPASPVPASEIPSLSATIRHGLANYTSYIAALPWSPAALILLISNFSTVEDTASFAFFLNLADRARLFLPAQLLQSYVEPIWTRRFNASKRVRQMTRPAGLLIKANVVPISFALFLLISFGDDIVRRLIRDSYVNDIHILILILVQVACSTLSTVLWIGLNVTGETRLLMRIMIITSAIFTPFLLIFAKYAGPESVIIICCLLPLVNYATFRANGSLFANLKLPIMEMFKIILLGASLGIVVRLLSLGKLSAIPAFITLAVASAIWLCFLFRMLKISKSDRASIRKLNS